MQFGVTFLAFSGRHVSFDIFIPRHGGEGGHSARIGHSDLRFPRVKFDFLSRGQWGLEEKYHGPAIEIERGVQDQVNGETLGPVVTYPNIS